MVTSPSASVDVAAIADSPHYRDLDGVRGVLAVMVMLYHYGINAVLSQLSGGVIGEAPWGAMVDFFFFLSGFVLVRAYLRKPRGISQALVERAFRLLPVHLVLMLLFAPLYLAMRSYSALELVADWTATSLYVGTGRWNGPSWSINIELYVPVILAGLLMLRRSAPIWLAWAGLIALMAFECLLAWQLALGAENFLVRGLVGLATGALLYRCTQGMVAPRWGQAWLLPLLTIVMLMIVAASGVYAPLAVLGPPVMAVAIWAGTGARSILGRGIFALVGALSYTIYMVHQNLKTLLLYLMGLDEFGGAIAIKVALILAVFPCAWLLTRYVEIPGMALGKRVSRRMDAPKVLLPA